MDYPQEQIDLLRNIIAMQKIEIASLQEQLTLSESLVAEQKEIIEIDSKLQKALHEIIALLKGE